MAEAFGGLDYQPNSTAKLDYYVQGSRSRARADSRSTASSVRWPRHRKPTSPSARHVLPSDEHSHSRASPCQSPTRHISAEFKLAAIAAGDALRVSNCRTSGMNSGRFAATRAFARWQRLQRRVAESAVRNHLELIDEPVVLSARRDEEARWRTSRSMVPGLRRMTGTVQLTRDDAARRSSAMQATNERHQRGIALVRPLRTKQTRCGGPQSLNPLPIGGAYAADSSDAQGPLYATTGEPPRWSTVVEPASDDRIRSATRRWSEASPLNRNSRTIGTKSS
jgi:hypothetical protein